MTADGAAMKHAKLRAVAHNLADSLASGVSLLTGAYELDLYGDAARAPGERLVLDLMNGAVIEGALSPALATALARLGPEFARLCAAAGTEPGDCRRAIARFHARAGACGFTLLIEDRAGRTTEADYEGTPAHRARDRDAQGRIRRRPVRRIRNMSR